MPSRTRVPNLYELLNKRRVRLRYNLRRLASTPQALIVPVIPSATPEDLPRAIIKETLRIRGTNYYLSIWEDFRDFDGHMQLYGFTYSLRPKDPTSEPLFRFECHPDVRDASEEKDNDEETDDTEGKGNPYDLIPHFHTHGILEYPISRLHYPFQRSERAGIIFAIIAWIEVDLIKRFYDSGRVKKVD